MIPIPIPEGLELPDGPSEVTASVEMIDGELVLMALNGIPFEGEEEEMPEDDADFLSAVEQSMQPQ